MSRPLVSFLIFMIILYLILTAIGMVVANGYFQSTVKNNRTLSQDLGPQRKETLL